MHYICILQLRFDPPLTYHVLPQQIQFIAFKPGDLHPQGFVLHDSILARASGGIVSLCGTHRFETRVTVGIYGLIKLELAVERTVVALRDHSLRYFSRRRCRRCSRCRRRGFFLCAQIFMR